MAPGVPPVALRCGTCKQPRTKLPDSVPLYCVEHESCAVCTLTWQIRRASQELTEPFDSDALDQATKLLQVALRILEQRGGEDGPREAATRRHEDCEVAEPAARQACYEAWHAAEERGREAWVAPLEGHHTRKSAFDYRRGLYLYSYLNLYSHLYVYPDL